MFPSWLLRSKVAPTRHRVELLDRRALILQLNESVDATVTVVHAPAGYGKSTILTSWRSLLVDDGSLVGWLSLGKEDDEAHQLLTYVAFALTAGGVEFESKGITFEHHYNELSVQHFLSICIHAIAEQECRVVLMLDDFENLGRKVIADVIHPLLKWAPDNLHVAIATRDDTKLTISNLEAKGKAVRFGANQLRFRPQELAEFFGTSLDGGMIERVFQLTEGWPVALQMIRGAINQEGDAKRILDNLTADRTSIASYLSEEVLSNLDESLQIFLMRISLVDRISCDLADYLCDSNDSSLRFQAARSLDALVLPVDEVEATYRLHPLFREHLYERLKRTRPEELRTLHLRAAHWFNEHGYIVEAVRHCVLAGEPRHSIPYIVQAGGLLSWCKDGMNSLRAVIHELDRQTILYHPRVALLKCLLDVKDGRLIHARHLYEAIASREPGSRGRASQDPDAPDATDLVAMGAVISLCEGRPISEATLDELERMTRDAGIADAAAVGNWSTFLCLANLQRGKFSDARRFGELAASAFESVGSWYSAAYVYLHLGAVGFAEGKSDVAARFYEQCLALSRIHFNDDQGIKLVASILVAQLKDEMGTLGSASSQIRMVPRQLERHEAWFDVHIAGYALAAHQEFNEQGVEAGLEIVRQGIEHAEANELPRLVRLLKCLKIELLLRAGMHEEARIELDDSGIDAADYRPSSGNQSTWLERDAAILAISNILVREGRRREALQLLQEFYAVGAPAGHISARMKAELLMAVGHAAEGAAAAARAHLEAALAMAAASHFVRPFLDEARVLLELLEQYADGSSTGSQAPAQLDIAQSILVQCRKAMQPRRMGALLSDRESEVLRQLAHGYSNKGIARRISVSDNTVRFHLRNIFAKLNVENRVQAVAAARKLNII